MSKLRGTSNLFFYFDFVKKNCEVEGIHDIAIASSHFVQGNLNKLVCVHCYEESYKDIATIQNVHDKI